MHPTVKMLDGNPRVMKNVILNSILMVCGVCFLTGCGAPESVKDSVKQSAVSVSEETAQPTTVASSEIQIATEIGSKCAVSPVLHPSIKGNYKGDCKNGLASGYGIATGKDRYEGNFLGGKMYGKGVYHFANGDRYDGEFFADKKNGQGVLFMFAENRILAVRYNADIRIEQPLEPIRIQNDNTDKEKSLEKSRESLKTGMMTIQGLVIAVKKPEGLVEIQTDATQTSSKGEIMFGFPVKKWFPINEVFPLRQ